ncbi:MAG: TetR/AcrR family transcriptional regulator [Acidobacteria bacterium]|nr:TetR/AcrR family transcriptional regulator [Acidobacteriota bacterium]MBV9146203.1 TetR/AcrR family transcriptional regulator [Acidobacteriota bacterium]MBV9438143.1 TetR/AcrR family transcriptional regulator [Acidobacteriota bacterium]
MAQTRQIRKGKSGQRSHRSGESGANGLRTPDKRRRILDAAIEVIAERGFHSSRVADIAERAGVADGTVYLYFKSKEQILMAALDGAFERFYQRAKEELAPLSNAPAKLRALARLHLRLLNQHRSLAVVLQTELRQSAKFLAEFSHRELKGYFDLIREIIREGQQAGTIRSGMSDKIAAACLFGSLDELVTSWVLSNREYDLAAAADPVIDLLLSGMEARP